MQQLFREVQGTHYLATSVATNPGTEVRKESWGAVLGASLMRDSRRDGKLQRLHGQRPGFAPTHQCSGCGALVVLGG